MAKQTLSTKRVWTHPALLFIAGLVLGALGLFAGQWLLNVNARDSNVASSSYQFTNPNLQTIPFAESFTTSGRNTLESDLQSLINSDKANGTLAQAGIYFRDLNNGPVFGINQDTQFSPASLLKLPLAIAYYHQLEDTDPGVMAQQIQFTGPKGESLVHYPPSESIEPGQTYTIEDLIGYMLKKSDNDAATILSQYLSSSTVNQVYEDLGVEQVTNYNLYTISVRDYAAFFRILYNSTYLSRDSSESLLKTMSEGDFTVGLVAGVPAGTTVSHKFGERVVDPEAPLNQLNDCGIIYAPQHPYILCVMAQGKSYDDLAAFIAQVSQDVYGAVTRQSN